ncbi:MAG: ABC transporter permease [Bacillota bacterium]
MRTGILVALFASAFRLATPLILSSLGGIFSEKSGVVNIALEGIMIMGAFFSVLTIRYIPNAWVGVLVAMIVGMITASLLAVLAIHLKANQVVAGVAINLLAASLVAFIINIVWNGASRTDEASVFLNENPFKFLENIPLIGKFFDGLSPFTYLAVFLVVISYYVLNKTSFGLRLRAVGEHPRAADTVGIDVYKIRYIAVIISGAFAGLSGASLTLGAVPIFNTGMTAGKGFIAIAAMIFGKWKTFGALGASVFFGFAESIKIQAGTIGLTSVPSSFLSMIPYVATVIALVLFVGKSVGPSASGEPYEKGHR